VTPGLGLEGRQVAVLGVADSDSIAWGIAKAFLEHGARVTIGYQQRFFSRIRPLLQQHPELRGARCDVLVDAELGAFFESYRESGLDVLVHSIAFAAPEMFAGRPSDVGAEAFAQATTISAHSLAKVVRFARPHFRPWASVMSVTFQASTRAVPMYGLMGAAKAALECIVRYLALELGEQRVRVNAISPGAVATLATMGPSLAFVRDPETLARMRGDMFREAVAAARAEHGAGADEVALAQAAWLHVQKTFAGQAAIPELISKEDVAGTALYLGSDLSRKVTGQVFHVDGGLSSVLIF